MSEAERLHRHLIGQQGSRRSLNTPALVLDLDMLDRNIAEMASFAKAHGMKLRPHSKTHKSADIVRCWNRVPDDKPVSGEFLDPLR